jgi:hypothetical protein
LVAQGTLQINTLWRQVRGGSSYHGGSLPSDANR